MNRERVLAVVIEACSFSLGSSLATSCAWASEVVTMTVLHVDLLYLSARTHFHTDIIMKNKHGKMLGTLKPIRCISGED